MTHQDVWPLLDRFLDGELPPGERWQVAAHVAACPACGAFVAEGAALRASVRERLGAVTAPPGLLERVRAGLDAVDREAPPVGTRRVVPPVRGAAPWLWGVLAAAVALAVVAGLLAGLRGRGVAPEETGDVVAQHVLFAHDETLLDVQGDPAAVAAWLGARVGFAVPVPAITEYELAGARLGTLDGQPAAQVVYERETEPRYLSLFWSRTGGPAPARGQVGPTAAVSWEQDGLRGWLVADRPLPDLDALADRIRGG